MDAVERIEKDIELFAKNIKEIESIKLHEEECKVVEMARNYRKDTDYYLRKKGLFNIFRLYNLCTRTFRCNSPIAQINIMINQF